MNDENSPTWCKDAKMCCDNLGALETAEIRSVNLISENKALEAKIEATKNNLVMAEVALSEKSKLLDIVVPQVKKLAAKNKRAQDALKRIRDYKMPFGLEKISAEKSTVKIAFVNMQFIAAEALKKGDGGNGV